MPTNESVSSHAGTRLLSVPLICAALVLLVAAVFGQTAQFGFVNFDDQQYVYENPMVRRGLTWDGLVAAFSTFSASNWHPLTWISHMADVSLFGVDAAGHHVVSVLLHSLNTVLLFTFLRRATGATWRCALVAAVFAIHPLRAESVAWISERKDVLSAAFFLLTLHAWLSYVRRPRPAQYVAALALFGMSLLAKQTFVTLPFLLLLLDWWPLGRSGVSRLVREKVPFLALSGGLSVVAWLAQDASESVVALDAVSLDARVANAVVASAAYVHDAFWPTGLAAFYPHPSLSGVGMDWSRVAVAVLLLVAMTAVAIWQRGRRPWVLAGWFWYLGTLVPVIGIVQVGAQARADRYTYMPLVGVFMAVAWLLGEIAQRSGLTRRAVIGLAAFAVGALAVAGHSQAATWRDSFTLHRNALANTERNWQAWTGLGDALSEAGRPQEAIAAYHEALRVRPEFSQALGGLGVAYGRLGDPARAIGPLEHAVRLRPAYAEGWYNLGTAYGSAGRHADAALAFRSALRANPVDARAWANFGIASLMLGDGAGVSESYAALLRLDPAQAELLRARSRSRLR